MENTEAKKPKKPNLHTSAMSLLYKCGEAYRRRYIEGHKIPPGVAASIGGATHVSVEADLKNKIARQELLSTEEIESIAHDAIAGKWKEEIILDDEEVKRGVSAVKAESIDTTIALARIHHQQIAPAIKPTHVERPIVIELEGYPVNLAGKIDVQEVDAIRDTKTAAKSPNQAEADDSEQLTTYSLFRKIADGVPPGKVFLDKLVKLKTPKAVTVESVRTEADIQMQMRRFERAIEVIEKGAFVPTDPTSWACSRKFCGYFQSCPFSRRPVSVSMHDVNPQAA